MRGRFAGMSGEEVAEALAQLEHTRDRVLDGARLREGDRVLDLGSGTGLLALGALGRIGEEGEVIALDVSVDCLEELERECADPRAWYLLGSAEVIPLPDGFVDAAVMRSVLLYVREKAEAARELFRVLRPAGRLSIFEPVNRRNLRLHEAVDFGDLQDLVAAWEERCCAPDNPIVDFDAEDLVRLFAEAGFAELEQEVGATERSLSAGQALHVQGAPGRPTLAEAWAEAFAPEEVERLVAALRQAGSIPARWPYLYLRGVKPA